MASEIRVNRLSNRSGLSTITFANGGVQFSGITTFANGDFRVGTGATILNPSTNEMQFHTGGSSRLTINNSGATIGALTATTGTFSSNVSIGGVLTYEDVKNVDAIGIVTARSGAEINGGDLKVGTAVTFSAVTGNVTQDVGITTFSGSATWFKGLTANKDMYWSKSSGSLVFKDNAAALFGTSSDLQIKHDGSNSWITNSTGVLVAGSADFQVANVAGTEQMIRAYADGAVELYHNNGKKIETTSSGVTISGNINIPDSSHLYLGASNDLDLYHTAGADSFLVTSSGQMYQRYANNLYIQLTGSNENAIVANANGAVELYHDGTRKAYTNSGGFALDSHLIMGDDDIIKLGNGADFKIYHSGSENRIEISNGNLFIDAVTQNEMMFTHDSKYMIRMTPDAQVKLYHNGNQKLETTSSGVNVTGSLISNTLGIGAAPAAWQQLHITDANPRIRIESSGTNAAKIQFADNSSGDVGVIEYSHSDNSMRFNTNSKEQLRITTGGQLIQYTTHTTGNSAHEKTSWYGDDASQYTIEIRDFNEMYAVKTDTNNNYNSIIYKREKMTNYCDIEFTMTGAHDSSGSGYMHVGMVINGDGSDTHSNFDRLVFRSHGGSTSSNHIRIDKGGGGTGFTYQTSNLPIFFDGNERHYQIKIRGRRFSIYIDGSHVVTRYTDANLVRTHGFFGINIYEASTVNPWIKVRDFKVTNHTPNTGVPGWETVFDTPAHSNASSSFVIDNMDNPQTVELRFWRLRHSGGDTNTYFRLGWQGSYKSSGYYDIAQYHNESGGFTASRGHNQAQGQPFHYDFTASTNYYSGVMTIRRVTSGGQNTGFVYHSDLVVDYDSGSTQYHIMNSGQVNFGNTNPWTKIQLYTNSGTNFNYGSFTALAQY